MDYQYKQISCYYSKGNRIILIPKGELLPFGGAIDIEPVIEIKLPVSKNELESKIKECFSYCWSKTITGFPKGPSVVELFLNIKGYKKIVQQFDLFELTFNILDNNYDIRKMMKSDDYKCYSGMEMIEMEQQIDFDYINNLIGNKCI